MSWFTLGGVVFTLVIVAIIVQLFLTWSTRRGWFRYKDEENPQRMGEGAEVDVASPAESDASAPVSHESDCRLAVYGTLGPGRSNHHQLSGLSGRWMEGTVSGQLIQDGWGAALGYPGIVLDNDGPTVDVQLFESLDLPEHWARLDEFEGSGYWRTVTTVITAEGGLSACIYVLDLA